MDQGEIYEAVCQALYEGDCICVFPEGGSHDQLGLLPLKPGVAIMALNAALLGVEDVFIIPVGIHYYERHKFGSKAVVDIGTPLTIPLHLVEKFARDQKRESVNELMNDIRDALNDCIITATDYETMNAIDLCSVLYPPERINMPPEKSHQLYRM